MTLTTTTTTPTYEQQNQTHQMKKNPMTVFAYALKAPESRRQYPRRLKIFLDYLGLEGARGAVETLVAESIQKLKR